MTSVHSLEIVSPKRAKPSLGVWEGFFPYYAGFPETFAQSILKSAELPPEAIVLDPWNGSGTTTYAATATGLGSIGIDLNPVMVIIARSRLLSAAEADTLCPLGEQVLAEAQRSRLSVTDDPLTQWFANETAQCLRSIEASIRAHLVGALTRTVRGARLEFLSGLASTNYVALFSVARDLARPFRSSNPTWFRKPQNLEERVAASWDDISTAFMAKLASMTTALLGQSSHSPHEGHRAEIRLGDAASPTLSAGRVDFVLTSPPYCTRIDYTAATRIELALVHPLAGQAIDDLRRRMTGTPISPRSPIFFNENWGPECKQFLSAVKNHSSRASSGYYYNTHVDYFCKISRSMKRIAESLKINGVAIIVVQDSYYKDIHNNLPVIMEQIALNFGLKLVRREDFRARSMRAINASSRTYSRVTHATEAVLCFKKSA